MSVKSQPVRVGATNKGTVHGTRKNVEPRLVNSLGLFSLQHLATSRRNWRGGRRKSPKYEGIIFVNKILSPGTLDCADNK